MEHNKQLPQIKEIFELLQKARDLSVDSLQRIEKLSSYATQIQGRTTFIKQSLKEQAQIITILSEQNPQVEILRSSKDRIDEVLAHSLELTHLSEQSLEVLDASRDQEIENQEMNKASALLKSVIACLDLIAQEKLEAFVQTTASNQDAMKQEGSFETLQTLKNHLKGS